MKSIYLEAVLAAAVLWLQMAAAHGQPEPTERWRVDFGEVYCSMARTLAADQVTLLVRTVPGTTISELLIASRAWRDLPLRAGETVSLQIGGSDPIEMPAGAIRRDSGTLAIGFQELPGDYLERLTAGGEIRVTRRGEVAVSIASPPAASAVTAMRACIDQRLAGWGVDPRARAALRRPAEPIRGRESNIVNPVNAVFRGDAGMIIVRANVDARGRLSECHVVRSGGTARESAGCRGLVQSAHYRPAIGADGRPAASAIIDILYVSSR